MDAITPPGATQVQGYIDERSTHHIRGWLRNLADARQRLAYEIVLPDDTGERVLHAGIADGESAVLMQVGVGDGSYAFNVLFDHPVSEAERDRIFGRATGSAHRLELVPELKTDPPEAGVYQGYIDERSTAHIAGWVRDLADPTRRVDIEIVLPEAGGEQVLQRLRADQYNDILRQVGVGDGTYAFFARFVPALGEVPRDAVFLRPAGSAHRLELAPALRTEFEPIHHVAMDIVDNCNLRCPFCVYDYTHTNKTHFMTEATFDAALRLIPFVGDGNFWLSCLHEATLHPRLVEFIERVPLPYRRKLFFTTNLAKRMPRTYFEALATSGMSHINISLESLDGSVYERVRKGARFAIFLENWRMLLEAFAARANAPKLRYNIMAYRSNLQEIPRLAEILLREKSGWQVEIRHTFDAPYIPPAFHNAEYLTTAEWARLAAALKHFSPEQVLLLLPPDGRGFDTPQPETAPPYRSLPPSEGQGPEISTGPVPRPFNLRIAWDGMLSVYAELPRVPGEAPGHANYLYANINGLDDPLGTLFAL
jgi:Radical SAM superfamily